MGKEWALHVPDPARHKTICAGPDLRTEVLHNPHLQAAKTAIPQVDT